MLRSVKPVDIEKAKPTYSILEESKIVMDSAVTVMGKSDAEFVCILAALFPTETTLLCGDVQQAPGISLELVPGFAAAELPSSILLRSKILKSTSSYNRNDYIELDRGFASAIALRQVLLGSDQNYKNFIRAQTAAVALSREDFDKMHAEYNVRLKTDKLKVAAIYMAAYNDVGKATSILNAASKIKGKRVLEHDEANAIIVRNTDAVKTFLPGLAALDNDIQDLIREAIGLDFNPSCMTQGEYPLYAMQLIADALESVRPELREDLFSLVKIEAAMDVAGARGHQAPGGASYSKFVHPAFEVAFTHLAKLLKAETAKEVYIGHLNEQAKKYGLELKDQHEQMTLTRVAMMIRATNTKDGRFVLDAFQEIKKQDPEIARNLLYELSINNLYSKTSVWMQYSPDLLRILTRESIPGELSSAGLMLGLRILNQVLTLSRMAAKDTPCFMAQGRLLIPSVVKATKGDSVVMNLLIQAAEGKLLLIDGDVRFPVYKIEKTKEGVTFTVEPQQVDWTRWALVGGSAAILLGTLGVYAARHYPAPKTDSTLTPKKP